MEEEEILNFSGKLFTGIVALILIVTACIVPVYIADKWKDTEISGSSAIPISELWQDSYFSSNYTEIDNVTNGMIYPIPYYDASETDLVSLQDAHSGANPGKMPTTYRIGSSWYQNGLETYAEFDTDPTGMDEVTFPNSQYKNYVVVTIHFLLSVADLDGADATHILVYLDIYDSYDGVNGDAFTLNFAKFGYALTLNGAVYYHATNFSPWIVSGTHPPYFWINLTANDITSISTHQNGRAYKTFTLFFLHDGSIIRYNWNVAVFSDYYTPYMGYSHDISYTLTEEQWDLYNYTNTSVYVGTDFIVSYLDIQTWILGAIGFGIGILALAISPLWNPVTDYFTPSGSRRTRRRSGRGRRGGR
jgi:hypothetical protein